MSRRLFWPGFALILCLALFLRTFDISARPLHNDEGVNYHFIAGIAENGYYQYSHENYHGPAYFYLTWAMYYLVGDGDFALRSSAILAGVLLLIALLLLRGRLGDRFVLIASLLTALSSSLVFYSRYAIHESLFLLAGSVFALAVFRLFSADESESGQNWIIYLGAFSLALLIATKETFIINLFAIFWAMMSLAPLLDLWHTATRYRQSLFYGALIMTVLIALFFTGGFQWPSGLREMLLAVPQWLGRNKSDVGHFKPFWRYFEMFAIAEPYLVLALILAPIPAVVGLWKRFTKQSWLTSFYAQDSSFARFVGLWSIIVFLVYSYVKYKTPWLIISLTWPLILTLSWWLDRWIEQSRQVGLTCLAIVVFYAGAETYRYNWRIPYGAANPYSYVQTTDGMTRLVGDIEQYWKRHPESKVLIGVKSYWPLPYYFRHHKNLVEYSVPSDIEKVKDRFGVLILDSDTSWKPSAQSWSWKYYRLSDVQESRTYFRRVD